MPDLFISHSSHDSQLAGALCEALEDGGLRCFVAKRDVPPGREYSDEIVRAIAESCAVLLLITRHANGSTHVRREVEQAARYNRTIIPVRVAAAEPCPGLEYFIGINQWVELPDSGDADLVEFVRAVRSGLRPSGAVPTDPPPPERAALTSAAPGDSKGTPAASLLTIGTKTAFLSSDASFPLWSGRGKPDCLRFHLRRSDGSQPTGATEFKLDINAPNLLIGRLPGLDLTIPHPAVSRRCLQVLSREGRVFLRRHPDSAIPVRVGCSFIEAGEERALFHGEPLAFGPVEGSFHDGRYVPAHVPAQAIDPRTGLMGRLGLDWEVALHLKIRQHCELLLVRDSGPDPEGAAVQSALVLHVSSPHSAVARVDGYAAIVLADASDLDRIAAILLEACPRALLGRYRVAGHSAEASSRIDQALGALLRLVKGACPPGNYRLAEHVLPEKSTEDFVAEAPGITAGTGGIGLLALEQTAVLEQIGARLPQALEFELLQVVGAVTGSGAILTRPVPGVVAFASANPPELALRKVVAKWRAKPAIQGEVLELDRGVAIQTLAGADIQQLRERSQQLALAARGAGSEGLPYPIAVHAQRFNVAETPAQLAMCAGELLESVWRFLAIALFGMTHAVHERAMAKALPGENWQGWATALSPLLRAMSGRVGELVRSCFDDDGLPNGLLHSAGERIAALVAQDPSGSPGDVSALRQSVGELLASIQLLRGWTLTSMTTIDRVDAYSDVQRLRFIDYTGSAPDGLERELTTIRDLRVGPFVYLTRIAEGIAAPLEPMMRCGTCGVCGRRELFWARGVIVQPGTYDYLSVGLRHVQRGVVSERQIPRLMRAKE